MHLTRVTRRRALDKPEIRAPLILLVPEERFGMGHLADIIDTGQTRPAFRGGQGFRVGDVLSGNETIHRAADAGDVSLASPGDGCMITKVGAL